LWGYHPNSHNMIHKYKWYKSYPPQLNSLGVYYGLLIQGWHYIKVVSSHFGMEHIRNIQIQISETTAAWWKKSIISLWLRPINIIVYPLDSCYGSMVATFLGRPPGRPPGWNMVKRHSPSTPFYPVLQKKISHEMPSRSPYVAYIPSFFLLICISWKMQKLPFSGLDL